MDYKGEWGGGGPGHSWALKWHERRHRWQTLSCEYLREFSKKIETVLMEYAGAGGKLIHEKNQKQKTRDTVPLNLGTRPKGMDQISIKIPNPKCRLFLITDQ